MDSEDARTQHTPTALRDTGIDVLGQVPWGTHCCQFYHTRQDLLDILVPYFRAGLLSNEYCIWITAEPLDVVAAESALRTEIPDLDEHIARGQIEMRSGEEWYFCKPVFDAQEIIATWLSRLKAAIDRGFDGTRIAGNIGRIDKTLWPAFNAYEQEANKSFRNRRVIAICSYSLEFCGASEILDIMADHRSALVKRHGRWEDLQDWRSVAEELASLAKFPSQDPNPVMRISKEGLVCYRNNASLKLADWCGRDGRKASHEAHHLVLKALARNKDQLAEIQCGDRTYTLTVAPIAELGYVNIYALDTTERNAAEREIKKQTHALSKRVQELHCLYALSTLVAEVSHPLLEVVHQACLLLPPAWQYPARACARIICSGAEFATDNFKLTRCRQTANVFASGRRVGSIDVCYRHGCRLGNEPFLPEERDLLDTAALLLGNFIERKNAEEARVQAEQKYRALVEDIPAITYIATLDPESNAQYISPQVDEMLGIPHEEYMADADIWRKQLHPEDRDRVLAEVARMHRTGEPLSIEYRMLTRDGRELWFIDQARVVADTAGKPQYLLGVMYNITDRKLLEGELRQSQKMEAVGKLAGGIAHDFNNILQAILGYVDVLKTRLGDQDESLDDLMMIETAAGRAAQLVRQLLGFARKDTSKAVPVDLHALIRESIQLISRTFPANISIGARFDAASAVVTGDPNQLLQVLLNLSVNARDAMPSGGTLAFATEIIDCDQVCCVTQPGLQPGRHIRLAVSDTGCGMPCGVRERIFEPFFTTKKPGEGSGMGLAAVYGIVKRHNGEIHLHSEEGRGTTFHIRLPLAETAAVEPRPKRAAAPVQGRGRVLVVDDDNLVRNVTVRMLESIGCQVVAAACGGEAIEHYRRDPAAIDLAIIDLAMPQMDGCETFRMLRQINPAIRAILSTGYDRDSASEIMIEEGMLGLVQKPFDVQELSRAVEDALSGKEMKR